MNPQFAAISSYQNVQSSKTAGGAFWSTLKRIFVAAGAVNALWVALFFTLGSTPLALLSVCSMVIYWACYRLIEARKNTLALALWWTEVLGHVCVATLLLGWSSAYHLFLFLGVPALLVSSARRQAIHGTLAVVALFFALHFASIKIGPLAPLPLVETMVVTWLNYLIIFVFLYLMTAVYRKTVRRAEEKMHVAAMTDSLTGVSNRAHFHIRAATEVARARREINPVCLLLVDVDHFKRVNDHHGHEAGDIVLKEVARTIQVALREIDVLARWGGEEFLIMLPGSSLERSAEVAKRLCDTVAAKPSWGVTEAISVTISIGVTAVRREEELNVAVGRADSALYASKDSGRNRVTVDSK